MRRNIHTAMLLLAAALLHAPMASAQLYAYVNEDGDYVVSQKRPDKGVEYAILTDDGEFVRLVQPRDLDVPITHWRPWFIPEDPDPFEIDPGLLEEREGEVGIEEVEPRDAP